MRAIGSGGFGTVWLARNATTGKRCAVKVIPKPAAAHGGAAAREIVSLTRLEASVRHGGPHLMAIHHVGTTADHLFYVMDLADPESVGADDDASYSPATLDGRLRVGPLDADTALACARALLAGLSVLHAAGMVHRDVKPSNCLFVGGTLRLADFGLVAPAGPDVSRIGTSRYMPPDGRMDLRADVWASGLVIYEMLSGLPANRFPHLGPRAAGVAGDPTLRALLRLALAACERDPARRPPDATAAAALLERLLAESSTGAGTEPARTRRTILSGLASAAILASAALLVLVPGSFRTARVTATFLTRPELEATVLLDGRPLPGPDGRPATTPCTIDGISAGVHRVSFRLDGRPDLDAGEVDFRRTRQVRARWPEE